MPGYFFTLKRVESPLALFIPSRMRMKNGDGEGILISILKVL